MNTKKKTTKSAKRAYQRESTFRCSGVIGKQGIYTFLTTSMRLSTVLGLLRWEHKATGTQSRRDRTSKRSNFTNPITLAIGANTKFELAESPDGVSKLSIAGDARINIVGGSKPLLGWLEQFETKDFEAIFLPVVFVRTKRGDAIKFLDLADSPARSLGSPIPLYVERDESFAVANAVVDQVGIFANVTEMKTASLSNRSRNLFTFSAIQQATKFLLQEHKHLPLTDRISIAVDFWNEVSKNVPAWISAKKGEIIASDYRQRFVCAHGIALAAIARMGRSLLARFPNEWKRRLKRIKTIDWQRANFQLWEGRAMIGGRLSKASACVVLTGNLLKQVIELELDEREKAMESQFRKSK